MTGKIGIDFGTSNTVIGEWDETLKDSKTLDVPGFSRTYIQDNEPVFVIPSLIHYTEDNRRWIGEQVIQQNLYHSRRTFRWMKRYIAQKSPIRLHIDGRDITPFDAAGDFLSTLLIFARKDLTRQDEEIGLSVPVEAFEHYENWLISVAERAGMQRLRVIDEPSAAALGYGANIQPGNSYLIFDFGGGTMHASVILIEQDQGAVSGRRCRVLGKAGKYIGGTSIDQWIFEDVLKKNRRNDYDDAIRLVSNSLLVECEKAKESLSTSELVQINVPVGQNLENLTAEFSRSQFEEMLDQHNLFTDIQRTIRSALTAASDRGYREDDIQAVLMVGGSSQIPSVQKTLRQMFGKDKVSSHRPLDAVARGTAAFVAGVDFYDHIQHNYAIRYVNSDKGDYDYRVIVPRGTPYPTHEPVARLTIKAAHENQKRLGLAIYEMGEERSANQKNEVELVFDPSGAARIMQVNPQQADQRTHFWMNEESPMFLIAEPPAQPGEPRFEVEFHVDPNKRLLISAKDIVKGSICLRNEPVIKLT